MKAVDRQTWREDIHNTTSKQTAGMCFQCYSVFLRNLPFPHQAATPARLNPVKSVRKFLLVSAQKLFYKRSHLSNWPIMNHIDAFI